MRFCGLVLVAILAGCGDNLAAVPDAALPDALTYPDFFPDMPTVISGSGTVMPSVRVVPVLFTGELLRTEILDFPNKLAAIWPAMVGEYGVGALTSATPVDLGSSPTGVLESADIQAFMAGQLDGTHAEWGPVDADTLATTIYVLYYPDTLTVHLNGQVSCQQFGAYHDKATGVNGQIIFAVIPRCPGNAISPTVLDELTAVVTHELVEAATDPRFDAFANVPAAHIDWKVVMNGAEIGDMCQNAHSSYGKPDAVGYQIQRSWSNASAIAYHDPCVPIPAADGPYFNSAPLLPDRVPVPNIGIANAVTIAVGASRIVPVQLFSDGPLPSPWVVHAADIEPAGMPPALQLSFDRAFGSNGDTIHLTIKVLQRPPTGYASILVTSSYGPVDHVWVSGVSIPQ